MIKNVVSFPHVRGPRTLLLIAIFFKGIMKLNGFTGKGTGKLGSSVFSVNGGEQIVRQYQSVVANPNTEAQVDQRAKMKLMSQVAAALAPILAFRKAGLKSARNLFISKNFTSVTATEGEAEVNIPNLQITQGTIGLPAINASRTEGAIAVTFSGAPTTSVATRVVFCLVTRANDGSLVVVDSAVINNQGTGVLDHNFEDAPTGECFVFAYGIKDADAAATSNFGNYNVATAADVAKLVSTRKLSTADYTFTKTVGVMVAAQG